MTIYENAEVALSLTNPLPVTLTGGVFSIEGTGISSDEIVRIT